MIAELYKTWNIDDSLAVAGEFSCYESVLDQLSACTKEVYDADPEGTIERVFEIYRSINVVPITYYTEQGLVDAVREFALTVGNPVVGDTIGLGNNQGQRINRFLFPNMMTAEPKGRGSNSLKDRFYNDTKLRRAIRICYEFRDGNNPVHPQFIRTALELVTGENITNFKPLNARAIVESLCPYMWGNVYDYSAGYGGRLLGIATSNMRYNYTCVDPNTETVKYLEYLNELIANGIGNLSNIVCSTSEDYVPENIDCAFSSPPYFNLEKYSDEPTQCMVKYTTMDEWFDGYVVPTMTNIYRGLNDNGIFATNIADYKAPPNKEYTVVEPWIQAAEKIGFTHSGTIKMMLTTRPGVGNDRKQGREKWEGVYVFTK